MFTFDTKEGDTVEIEGPDQWHRNDLYVEHSDGSNVHGLIVPREGSQLEISQYMMRDPPMIFEMKLTKANESTTNHLTGCRFGNSNGQFKADFVNVK
ncbi:hypothetical protein [Saliphagus sp. LR7]|uniref:hypothetical protein n=1 Tax=Saliphagus sp. LR7 TaxID=2282654 RepID=UPI001300929F|nr:hypothetical protein [Saliphagus sp. LR7]